VITNIPISLESVCDREQGLLIDGLSESSLKDQNLSEELKVITVSEKQIFEQSFWVENLSRHASQNTWKRSRDESRRRIYV